MTDIKMDVETSENPIAVGNETQTAAVEQEVQANGEEHTAHGPVKAESMEADGQNSNGSVNEKYQNNPNYATYLSKKLSPKVAEKLIDLCEILNLTNEDFDERAVEMLASFSADQGIYILDQLQESQMYGVQNKPQYLMSVMRNLKERIRTSGSEQATSIPLVPGPSVDSIKAIIERTGYQLEVTVGQRKFHNPPDGDGVDHEANSGACVRLLIIYFTFVFKCHFRFTLAKFLEIFTKTV
jgi:hypothetical protein